MRDLAKDPFFVRDQFLELALQHMVTVLGIPLGDLSVWAHDPSHRVTIRLRGEDVFECGVDYDPLLAKWNVWGRPMASREEKP